MFNEGNKFHPNGRVFFDQVGSGKGKKLQGCFVVLDKDNSVLISGTKYFGKTSQKHAMPRLLASVLRLSQTIKKTKLHIFCPAHMPVSHWQRELTAKKNRDEAMTDIRDLLQEFQLIRFCDIDQQDQAFTIANEQISKYMK